MAGLGSGFGIDAEDPAWTPVRPHPVASIGRDKEIAVSDRQALRIPAFVEPGRPNQPIDRCKVWHVADRCRAVAWLLPEDNEIDRSKPRGNRCDAANRDQYKGGEDAPQPRRRRDAPRIAMKLRAHDNDTSANMSVNAQFCPGKRDR